MNSTAEAGTDEAKPAGAVGCGHFWFGKGARGLVVRGGDAGWNAFRRAARSDEPKKLVGCGRRRVATAAEWGPRPWSEKAAVPELWSPPQGSRGAHRCQIFPFVKRRRKWNFKVRFPDLRASTTNS